MRTYKLIVAAIIIQALYAFLPIIRLFPHEVRAIIRMTPFLLVTLGVFINPDKKLKQVYIIVNLFALLIGFMRSMVYANGIVESMFMNLSASMLYWITVVEGYYLVSHCNYRRISKILKFSLILIAFTGFTTIIGSILFPGAVKSSSDFSEEEFGYYMFNMGAYSFIYAITYSLPILFYYIKNKDVLIFKRNNNQIVIIFIIAEIFLTLVLSQYMTAFGAAIIGTFCFLCSSKKYKTYKKKLIKYSAMGVVALIVLAPIVGFMAEYFDENGLPMFAERLEGIYQVLTGGLGAASGDVGARIFLYGWSLQYLPANPVFGLWGTLGFSRAPYFTADELLNTQYATQCVGQHSDLLDLLGGNGLFGLLIFVGFIYWYWKLMKQKAVSERPLVFFNISMIMFIVYGIFDSSLACLDVALSIFVLTPIILLSGDNKEFLVEKTSTGVIENKPETAA